MWRTWRSPMMPASAASAGMVFCTSFEPATSACRVIAPISTAEPEALMPASSLMVPRSIRSLGAERRSFIACTRLCPPARYLPSVFCPARATASLVEDGRWYSNARMAFLLEMFPHCLRRGRHRHVLDAERVGDRVHHRRRRADRAGLAAALHAERVVRARGLARVDLEHGHVARARQAIVHHRAGEQLAARRVVAAGLGERLADALRDP